MARAGRRPGGVLCHAAGAPREQPMSAAGDAGQHGRTNARSAHRRDCVQPPEGAVLSDV